MAELPDFRGYEFRKGIEVLRRSIQTSLAALDRERGTLQQQLEIYRQCGKFEGERDEDGSILWEQDMFLGYEIVSINEASAELRKAFAIAAYHFWERTVLSWSIQEQESKTAKVKKLDTFKRLRHEAKTLGYSVETRLDHVNDLVNLLNTIV